MDLQKGAGIDPEKYDFIRTCIQENLQHARHVENERISFHGFYAALSAGALAFILELSKEAWNDDVNNIGSSIVILAISLIICSIMIVLGIMTLQLCERWSNTFERHLEYAKGCYYLLHRELFEKNAENNPITNPEIKERFELEKAPDSKKTQEPLRMNTLPLYCFRISDPAVNRKLHKMILNKNNRRTKVLFRSFDIMIIWALRLVGGILVYKLTESVGKLMTDWFQITDSVTPLILTISIVLAILFICFCMRIYKFLENMVTYAYNEEIS